MKVKKNTTVLLKDGTRLYVYKGTNKEDGHIRGYNIDKHWEMGVYTREVIKVLTNY